MRVVRLVPNTPLWQKAAGYARRCPWVAGPHLAQLMEEGAFTGWEAVFAALDGEEIVGFCTLMERDYYPENRYSPWISTVFVAQARRGQGICGLLVKRAQAYAKAQGFRRVYIPSGMVGLYEKYGYHKVDELVNYGGGRDAVFAKELTEEREDR